MIKGNQKKIQFRMGIYKIIMNVICQALNNSQIFLSFFLEEDPVVVLDK